MYSRIELRHRLRARPPRGIKGDDVGARGGERRDLRACCGDEDVSVRMPGLDDADDRRIDREPHSRHIGDALDAHTPAPAYHSGSRQRYDVRGFFQGAAGSGLARDNELSR
jgi:hypothetical protein